MVPCSLTVAAVRAASAIQHADRRSVLGTRRAVPYRRSGIAAAESGGWRTKGAPCRSSGSERGEGARHGVRSTTRAESAFLGELPANVFISERQPVEGMRAEHFEPLTVASERAGSRIVKIGPEAKAGGAIPPLGHMQL